jgi:hypothetical protein
MSWHGKAETFAGLARKLVIQRGLGILDPELATFVRLRGALHDVVPPHAASLDADSYVPAALLGSLGIEFHEREQLALLKRWGDSFQELFAALRAEPSINTGDARTGSLFNGQFHTPDAEVYSALIAERLPTRIVEVGAGYSTRIARRTIDELGLATELCVIDPAPRVSVESVADRFVEKRLEDAVSELGIDAGTMLFIDSSHVVRTGGDLPMLFNQIVPGLPAGVVVHVHDVFLPWDYPPAYQRRLYTEQYVLGALLAHSSRYRMLFSSHLMARQHGEEMRAAFGLRVGVDRDYFGSSLWFEIESPSVSEPFAAVSA